LHAKSRDSSPPSSSPAEIVGYTLAGVFVVALVAVAVILVCRRKKTKGDVYGAPYIPPHGISFHVKSSMFLFPFYSYSNSFLHSATAIGRGWKHFMPELTPEPD
jgi:hypothetical protein